MCTETQLDLSHLSEVDEEHQAPAGGGRTVPSVAEEGSISLGLPGCLWCLCA